LGFFFLFACIFTLNIFLYLKFFPKRKNSPYHRASTVELYGIKKLKK
jgi:hypothetical protein